jgi:hypothetical protein
MQECANTLLLNGGLQKQPQVRFYRDIDEQNFLLPPKSRFASRKLCQWLNGESASQVESFTHLYVFVSSNLILCTSSLHCSIFWEAFATSLDGSGGVPPGKGDSCTSEKSPFATLWDGVGSGLECAVGGFWFGLEK